MRLRTVGLFTALILVLVSACEKEPGSVTAQNSPVAKVPLAPEIVARLHWLGLKRLAADTNAAFVMRIWNKPETARLKAEALRKIARAPWEGPATNNRTIAPPPEASLLQPILDDLIEEESCLKVGQITNGPGELALAVHLSPARAALWQTNLARVLSSLDGTQLEFASSNSWRLRLTNSSCIVEFSRSSAWTLLGLSTESNSLIAQLQSELERDPEPFRPGPTNSWLEANFDLDRLASAFHLAWRIPAEFPVVALKVFGDGENVRTHGDLTFRGEVSTNLPAWVIPTNLVRAPLLSFTAGRSLGHFLQKLAPFNCLPTNTAPGQIYFWNQAGVPFKTFFAWPAPDARTDFLKIAPLLTRSLAPHIAPQFGRLIDNTNACLLNWQGLPFGSPFFGAYTNSAPYCLFGGLSQPFLRSTNLIPPELAQHILEGTNLVYFDWEITGRRISDWRYVDDVYHIIFDGDHAPRLRPDDASLQWVANVSTNLSFSVTELRRLDAHQLSFARKSSIGLTAFEIDVLLDWLESPEFPRGLAKVFLPDLTTHPFRPRARRRR